MSKSKFEMRIVKIPRDRNFKEIEKNTPIWICKFDSK